MLVTLLREIGCDLAPPLPGGQAHEHMGPGGVTAADAIVDPVTFQAPPGRLPIRTASQARALGIVVGPRSPTGALGHQRSWSFDVGAAQ